MSQRETLVARAIVAYEIGLLRERSASTPLPRLTTDQIVEKYGLQWGQYHPGWIGPGSSFHGASRARQNVRNELNRAFRAGDLCKLRNSATGKKVREGKCIVFVSGVSAPGSWRSCIREGYVRERAT